MENKSRAEPSEWLKEVDNFADALSDYATQCENMIFKVDVTTEVEYMRKAARLLKIMTVAYFNLSNQVNLFYEREQKLKAEAEEVVELVQNQMKRVKL